MRKTPGKGLRSINMTPHDGRSAAGITVIRILLFIQIRSSEFNKLLVSLACRGQQKDVISHFPAVYFPRITIKGPKYSLEYRIHLKSPVFRKSGCAILIVRSSMRCFGGTRIVLCNPNLPGLIILMRHRGYPGRQVVFHVLWREKSRRLPLRRYRRCCDPPLAPNGRLPVMPRLANCGDYATFERTSGRQRQYLISLPVAPPLTIIGG